jgi:hypothetical protein
MSAKKLGVVVTAPFKTVVLEGGLAIRDQEYVNGS